MFKLRAGKKPNFIGRKNVVHRGRVYRGQGKKPRTNTTGVLRRVLFSTLSTNGTEKSQIAPILDLSRVLAAESYARGQDSAIGPTTSSDIRWHGVPTQPHWQVATATQQTTKSLDVFRPTTFLDEIEIHLGSHRIKIQCLEYHFCSKTQRIFLYTFYQRQQFLNIVLNRVRLQSFCPMHAQNAYMTRPQPRTIRGHMMILTREADNVCIPCI